MPEPVAGSQNLPQVAGTFITLSQPAAVDCSLPKSADGVAPVPVGLGFVSICLSEKDCSPAGDVTVKSVERLLDRATRLDRIRRTARRNLANTLRILWFLKGNALTCYRFATHLIPLATHPVTDGWAWWEDGELRPLLLQIGEVVRREGFRVSTHPPQLCVLNSPDPEVFVWVERYTAYHVRLFDAMGLDETAKIVLHVGKRLRGGAAAGLGQALSNLERLPAAVHSRLALENDDRTFSAQETLSLCRRAGLPMVFDLHHHRCRSDGEDFRALLPEVFATWRDRPPKVHLSSPRSERDPRAHADFVDPGFVEPFLEYAVSLGAFDVMVEAKMKDLAALRLRADLPHIFSLETGPNHSSGRGQEIRSRTAATGPDLGRDTAPDQDAAPGPDSALDRDAAVGSDSAHGPDPSLDRDPVLGPDPSLDPDSAPGPDPPLGPDPGLEPGR